MSVYAKTSKAVDNKHSSIHYTLKTNGLIYILSFTHAFKHTWVEQNLRFHIPRSCRWLKFKSVLASCQEYFLLLPCKTASPCPIHYKEQLISCPFTTAFIPGHTAHPKDKVWKQNMGPNSDLSHLLTQHNYYLTQALLLTVESLPSSDHFVRVTTFDSAFYIILLWPSLFFSNKDFFFFLSNAFPVPLYDALLFYAIAFVRNGQ